MEIQLVKYTDSSNAVWYASDTPMTKKIEEELFIEVISEKNLKSPSANWIKRSALTKVGVTKISV
jgi:hypothetical protein